MPELEFAGYSSIDRARPLGAGDRARFPLSRAAFVVSVGVHVLAGYMLTRQVWPSTAPPQNPVADYFLFEMPQPRPPEAVPAPVPEPAQPLPEVRELPQPDVAPPAPRAAEVVEPPVIIGEQPVEEPPEPVPLRTPSLEQLDEARRRAAQEIVSERAAEKEYLTFSIDDVAPPRPVAEPKPERSIFEPGPGTRGPSVGQVGQARTKLGHRMSELCNALTGGFSLMGFGSFCGSGASEPSGLFPEVRPAYLDLLPECVDTRDTAPALALESPFPTIKCRLVKQVDLEDQP
jgi:hypothetical protein